MEIRLIEWSKDNRESPVKICNEVDRTYLSDGLPFPYNPEHADVFIENISARQDKSLISAISVDGEIAGSISVERKKRNLQLTQTWATFCALICAKKAL